MTTLISGCIMFLAGIVFVVSIVIANGPQTAKTGDVFVHANPGGKENPTEQPDPFTTIYRVTEINEGKAHIEGYYVHYDGRCLEYDRWLTAYGLGKYDEKVSR